MSHAASQQVGKTSLLNDLLGRKEFDGKRRELFEEEDRCVLSSGQIDLFFGQEVAYMDVTGKPIKESIETTLHLTNIVIIHVDCEQVEEDQYFLDKLQKWIVDIKAEDESIKIILILRDANEHCVYNQPDDIRSVIGEGVFEDDLAAVIVFEDLRDFNTEERKEMIHVFEK